MAGHSKWANIKRCKAALEAGADDVENYDDGKAELGANAAPKFLRLIDALEDLDDVQEVYHNGDISDDVAATLE